MGDASKTGGSTSFTAMDDDPDDDDPADSEEDCRKMLGAPTAGVLRVDVALKSDDDDFAGSRDYA